jgi:DNA-binding transcriptional MerR regulator
VGGSGSTRWNSSWKKTKVEECKVLPISIMKEGIQYVEKYQRAYSGSVSWSCGGEKIGSISYLIYFEYQNLQVNLSYRMIDSGEGIDCKVALNSTQLYWGAKRWWFVCPLVRNGIQCNQRVGKLYLPPGSKYFGCRHCYDLTYTSCQESHYYDSFYSYFADSLGMTTQEAKQALNSLEQRMVSKETEEIIERRLDEIEEKERRKQEKLSKYLTKDELSQQSGLSLEEIDKLEEYQLLVPDTKDGRYRPKLVGWGKKLKEKLFTGWDYEGIKLWSRNRWDI